MRRFLMALTVPLALVACAPQAEVDELALKVEALEKKVSDLESKGVAGGGAAAQAGGNEAQASALYQEVNELIAANKVDEAKTKLNTLISEHGNTRTAQRAVRVKQELDLFGKTVGNPAIEKWYVGAEADADIQSGTTLVVFWEVWCPHCRREVPKVQEMHTKYAGKLKVLGLTRITKSATEEKVTEFISENNLTYPLAKETGDAATAFAVSGIPAAAVVKDGTVVWRGHPGRLTEEMLEGWM